MTDDTVQTIDRSDPKYRRYVGVRETAAYLVYDMSQSFHIGDEKRFATTIVGLSQQTYAKIIAVNGVWDVVNDLFMGMIVDRTRTRWGKFKPYLMFLAIPGTILSVLYWLLPVLLGGSVTDLQRAAAYLALQLAMEGVGTFQGIARKGIMATITPFPHDRARLITFANLFSGLLGEKLPGIIFNGLLDFFDNGHGGGQQNLPKVFMVMGTFTVIVAGIGAFWFFYVCRERIQQSLESPSLRDSFRTILRNKPVLLLTLSQTLSGLSVGGSKRDYLIDVLHAASFETICGIPGAIINPFSYAWIPWFRRHFSDKTLYILGTNCMNIFAVPVFLVGSIGGKTNGVYKKRVPMAVVLALYEMGFTVFWGVRSVIPTEMYNESMDYCEWKNGYRGEAMISVARELSAKIAGKISGLATVLISIWSGYDPRKYVRGTAQTDKAKYTLFTMWTIIPAFTALFSVIPMLFYDLSDETKEQMYVDLQARRAAMATQATDES